MSQLKSTKGNEAIIEEFMWQMKGDQHNICGQYVPAFCDKQEKRLRTILAQKDNEVAEAVKESFNHFSWCRECGEGPFCREALSIAEKYGVDLTPKE